MLYQYCMNGKILLLRSVRQQHTITIGDLMNGGELVASVLQARASNVSLLWSAGTSRPF